ncbi:UPF0481 protein At3g47200-like isoform X2 [Manihot esculenta]|uniref:UPF0481 protein At3g47200-like isoform X2 n=1 Tax=Manihot esculenta TaxID=3983 RepID=UPI001CC3480B|nr:UPF0481 protein At3g47200-like isoform X2 [Manihot esculenta]
MENTKERIYAAIAFCNLSENEQKKEIQKLIETNELLGRVTIDQTLLQIESKYRVTIFIRLLSQLSPLSAYPASFLVDYFSRGGQLMPHHVQSNQLLEFRDFEPTPSSPDEELSDPTESSNRMKRAALWEESEPSNSGNKKILKAGPRVSVKERGTKGGVKYVPQNRPLLQHHEKQKAGASDQHVIIVPDDEHKHWLRSVEESIKEQVPKLLNKTAGKASCSIFRVPKSLVKIHPEAFQPQIVSIGPYHHGAKHLEMIQQHKRRFLGAVLARTQAFGVGLDDFYKIIAIDEKKIRECYSESTDAYNSRQLIEMLILDGLFIIELLCRVGKLFHDDPDDPIFKSQWIYYSISRDLLRLENQIPFFVLRNLFERSIPADSRKGLSLTELVLSFFQHSMPEHHRKVQERFKDNLEWKHVLDFLRSTFIPSSQEEASKSEDLRLVQPVEKLLASGIKFEQSSTASESFLDIKFKPRGVLEIPRLVTDDFISSFLLNCVAFEQCFKLHSTHFTSYVIFMGCLINTASDAGYLRDHGIIENYFGTDDEVVKYFNEVGKDVLFSVKRSYLAKVFEEVNKYYKNTWHVRWAEFKYTYFGSPWIFISALAAFILLLLTFFQSFFAGYAYFRPPN